MANIDVTISTSDERFFSALEHPEGLIPILAIKAEEIGGSLVAELEQYPPETEANSPGRFSPVTHKPMGFYERGRGWWAPRLTKVRDDNSRFVGPGQSVSRMKIKTMSMKTRGAGQAMLGAKGYKLKPESEQLGENWLSSIDQGTGEVVIVIGNLASYAGYVQGAEQADLLRKYGWVRIEEVLLSPFFSEVAAEREMEAIMTYYHLGGLG